MNELREEEASSAGPALSEPVAAALRAHVSAALASREWARFGPLVSSRIGALPGGASGVLDADATRALRESFAAELASRDWSSFAAEVMERVEAAIAAELSAPSAAVAALKADLGAELARRDGAWRAFAAQAEDAIALEDRKPLPERAIAEMRSETAAEVEAISPKLEREMPSEVAKEIAEPAKVVRISDWLRRRWVAGVAGIAAAAAAAVMYFAPSAEQPATDVERRLAGEVTVDDVEFEGNVTLIPGDGAAVIWLADAS